MEGERDSRRFRADWSLAIPLIMIVAILLVMAGNHQQPGSGSPQSGSSPTPALSAPPATPESVPSIDTRGPSQPDPAGQGYEYLLTRERWVVRPSPGHLEVQRRQRESWRAADGWAWARQTGDDPARYIFAPDLDGDGLRQTRPDVADLRRAVHAMLAAVPASELDLAQFRFVCELVGVETLPAGTLPLTYRKALVALLASSDQVTVSLRAKDPLGRDAIRIKIRDNTLTETIYLDQSYRYLAETSADTASGEHGYRVAVERRQVDAIPSSLLAALGSARMEKGLTG